MICPLYCSDVTKVRLRNMKKKACDRYLRRIERATCGRLYSSSTVPTTSLCSITSVPSKQRLTYVHGYTMLHEYEQILAVLDNGNDSISICGSPQ